MDRTFNLYPVCACHNSGGDGSDVKLSNVQVIYWGSGPIAEIKGLDVDGSAVWIGLHKDTEAWKRIAE